MLCQKCGKENRTSAGSCVYCGAVLAVDGYGIKGLRTSSGPAYPTTTAASDPKTGEARRVATIYSKSRNGIQRPAGIVIITILLVFLSLLGIIMNSAGLLDLFSGTVSMSTEFALPLVVAVSGAILLDVLSLAAAYGLWKVYEWGWVLAVFMTLGGIILAFADLGLVIKVTGGIDNPAFIVATLVYTLLAVIILFYLFRNKVMLLYEDYADDRDYSG